MQERWGSENPENVYLEKGVQDKDDRKHIKTILAAIQAESNKKTRTQAAIAAPNRNVSKMFRDRYAATPESVGKLNVTVQDANKE
jgi:hypothetical protein